MRLAKTAVKQRDLGLAARFIDELERSGLSDDSVTDIKKELKVLQTRLEEGAKLPVIERPAGGSIISSIPGIRIIKPKKEQTKPNPDEE